MAKVTLREICKDNWEECCKLRLATHQGGLVAPNLFSIMDSGTEAEFVQMGIYADAHMVGYVMYGLDPDDGEYWLYRILIDQNHQGMGYGKAAVEEAIQQMKERHNCHVIYAGYMPQNNVAGALLMGLGFRRTGQMLQGEYIAKLEI